MSSWVGDSHSAEDEAHNFESPTALLPNDSEASSGGAQPEAPSDEEEGPLSGEGGGDASFPDSAPNNGLAAEPPEVAGGSPSCGVIGNSTLHTFACEWKRATEDSSSVVSVACDSGTWAISGGCTTGTNQDLEAFRPYENGSPGDSIDNNDDLDDADGWWCRYGAAASPNNHAAYALCCPTFEVAECT